jgi:hypothetical protein
MWTLADKIVFGVILCVGLATLLGFGFFIGVLVAGHHLANCKTCARTAMQTFARKDLPKESQIH